MGLHKFLIKEMSKEFSLRDHPVFANIIVIFIVAIIGLVIVYLSLNVFTRHGEWDVVPNVENMSFTNAIKELHEIGFRTDIRDSVYKEDVNPGFVVEQFPKPGARVKPGRKIFLYINAVHPREYVIDPESLPGDALKGYSLRQGLAKLEELGFRKVEIKRIPGDNDRIIKILANGKVVSKMQKVPVNAQIIVEVHDGQLNRVTDSILAEEYFQYITEVEDGNINEAPDDEVIDLEPAIVQ